MASTINGWRVKAEDDTADGNPVLSAHAPDDPVINPDGGRFLVIVGKPGQERVVMEEYLTTRILEAELESRAAHVLGIDLKTNARLIQRALYDEVPPDTMAMVAKDQAIFGVEDLVADYREQLKGDADVVAGLERWRDQAMSSKDKQRARSLARQDLPGNAKPRLGLLAAIEEAPR